MQDARQGWLQIRDAHGTAVGEGVLGEFPDSFVGVEFGGISGKTDEVEAVDATKKLPDQSSVVGSAAVPEDEQVAADVTEKVAQEGARFGLLNVLEMQLEEEVKALASWADRNAGDDGDPITTVEVPYHWRLADGGPGLCDRRGQEEARFVGKDEVGAQPSGVFFTLGHSSRTKRRIFPSSRSKAFF